MGKGRINAATPRINKTLAMLLPSTLLIARSAFPLKLAMTFTISSGNEVPMETHGEPDREFRDAEAMRQLERSVDEPPCTHDQQHEAEYEQQVGHWRQDLLFERMGSRVCY
jgi:hypothetical protein